MAEIVHKGPLDMAHGMVGDKGVWKRRLFVLKKFKSSGTAALEFYKDTKKDFHKQEVKGVLNLMDNYQVEIVNPELSNCKRKNCFDVKTLESTYRLAADTEAEMDDWLHFLQTQTRLKPVQDLGISFHVRPQQTGANGRLRAKGECLLQMSQQGLKLAERASSSILAEWPLKCLRRYSCDIGQFQFEAGRKAPLGEGIYGFLTNEEETMFDVLDYLVKSTAGQLVSPPMALTQRHAGSFMNGRQQYDHLIHSLPDMRAPPPIPPPALPGQEYSVLSRSRATSPGADDHTDSGISHHTSPESSEYNTLQRYTPGAYPNRSGTPTTEGLPRPPAAEYNTLLHDRSGRLPAPAPAAISNGVAGGVHGEYDTLSHSSTSAQSTDVYNTLQHTGSESEIRREPGKFTHSGEYQQLSAEAEKMTINVNYGQPTTRYNRRGTRD